MKPHKVHIDPGKGYYGETYIWCECVLPQGMSPMRKVAVRDDYEDAVFQGTTREELMTWLAAHPEEEPAQPVTRVRRSRVIPEVLAGAVRRKDPYTPLERWFARLPNMSMHTKCHCGSGKPLVYWSPEEGDGCADCSRENMFLIYIPHAVMWNIMEKFGITDPETRERIFAMVSDPGEEPTPASPA